MNLLNRYLVETEFSSLQDFEKRFAIRTPQRFNFAYDVVDEMALGAPEQRALVWCNPHGERRTFTFADMKEGSDRAANFLRGLGIQKGDMVMVILKRRYEFWFVLLALHKLGAVAIPATHLLTAKDIVYRNNAAGIKAIICVNEPAVVDAVNHSVSDSPTLSLRIVVGGQAPEGWVSYDQGVAAASADFARPEGSQATENGDTSLLYFTSGTTGMPKMVTHNFLYPLGHIITAKYWHNCMDGGLHLTVSDTGWAKSAWGKIYGQWICGAAVMVYDYEKFVPAEILNLLQEYGVNTFCAPPTVFRFLIRENLKDYDFSSLRYATVAGEPLNPEVYNQFLAATGVRLMEGYGQTETTLLIGNFLWMEPRPGSMGVPSPGFPVDLVDENGDSCEPGQVGEIVVRTERGSTPHGMFLGYYRDDALTRSVWHDGLYHTGDMAWRDENGYFWYVGRADDVIKSSGYRIGPFEVESALMEHPAVLETAITGVPDPIRGQVIKATVVLNKGYQPSEALKKELQDHVKKVTAPYKYPRIVEFVDELPKTISGKIRRVELRAKDNKG